MAEKKKTWKYTEKHNAILGAICELMDPREEDQEESVGSDGNYSKTKKRVRELSIFPTSKQIAEKVGFSKAIVERHLLEINLGNFKATAQTMTPAVLSALTRTAMNTGRAAAVKLFFQLGEEWEEKSQVKPENAGSLSVKVNRKMRTSN